ncbi:MAG TPA: serine hydrolase domain-containing protein [Acidobacteriota bacterium]|nr:serine hydrolase domain-containing protein [Acidobacteriota bacterium]
MNASRGTGTLRRAASAAVLLALVAASFAHAAALPKARPAEVGMSAERLARLGRAMQTYVDDDRTKGFVVLLMRNGKVAYHEAFGKLDPEKGTPMPLDAIFRVASQTKAITTTAVMTLFEEGRFLLDDPISKYIPEFAVARVAVPSAEKGAKGYATVPVKRPITIRDLLTHTAGISYGTGPAEEEYLKAGVHGWNLSAKDVAIGDYIRKLTALPFDAQPGEKWVYGYNIDILGYLVERVSGMSLDDYIRKTITGPLGMTDTHFFLPDAKIGRFTPVYGVGDDGKLKLVEAAADNPYVKGPRKCFAGGAGLLATADNYARFLQMLLNGGELGGVRILGPKTVELMTADHVGNLYSGGSQGFGLGFSLTTRLGRDGTPGTPGAYGWGGAYLSDYWVDPVEKLVAVFMTQLLPGGGIDIQDKFKAMVYQSIVDSYER